MIPEMIRKYKVIESVGTGAFSEVFKAINVETGILVALKRLKVTEECRREVAKEVLIHQLLRHQNIIKFIESFECDENIFIVQELGSGGELFEQIEPDVGFPEQVAHFYFVQLIRTIMYLHKSGICHRDLKPENLLLDGDGNLKLADFGLSTVFRRGRIRRKLTTRCGTPAYMLPEVSKSAEYEGDDADIWSCCIILIILLTGNVPWETCTLNCSEFLSHVKDGSNFRINSLPKGPRRIINETLKLEPSKRWKISEISTDPWFIQANPLLDFNFMASEPAKLIQLIRENSSTQLVSLSIPPLALTQPDQIRSKASVINDNFSQPPSSSNSNEIELSESSKVFVRNNFARFLCKGKLKKVLEKMEQVLQEMLVPFKKSLSSEFALHFQTVDRRKCPLIGIIRLQNLDGSVLVVIKKQRGNPIEYGRFFKFIVDEFSDLI